MLRRSSTFNIRYVCLSWTSEGTSVGKALPLLGFKTYNMKAMLSQNQHGQLHPQLWDNLLRPLGEHYEQQQSPKSNENAEKNQNTPIIVKSRLVAQNKLAQKLGVSTQEKLKIEQIAEYDAIVGLPVAAISPEELTSFFPGYTKFILVEESNKPEWVRQHIEDGVVPILINLRNMMEKSPTGKTWYSLFRHLAWPGSAEHILDTLPDASETKEMIQPSFIQKIKTSTGIGSGGGDKPIPAPDGKSEALFTGGGSSSSTVSIGDIRMVQARRQLAEDALADYEKRVKAAIPSDRLYVYRDGDGWEPLLHFTGRDFSLLETTLPKDFPAANYGKDFLDLVRFRVVRTVMITKMVNATAIVVIIFAAWMLNGYFLQGIERVVDDAKKVTGQF